MKRFLTLIMLGLLVGACGSDIEENRETRSTVYKGQTTWDMYENFGAPTYAIRISPDETHFVYRREAITREWTRIYFDWCDMVFVVVDDHVTDWDVTGNQCYLNIADPVPTSTDNDRGNVLERYRGTGMPPRNTPDQMYPSEIYTESDTLF